MLEDDPQIEGSFQLHYAADRGRPVVCKESTAHTTTTAGQQGTHSTAHCTLHAAHSTVPNTPVVIFFHGCRVPVSSWLAEVCTARSPPAPLLCCAVCI